MGISRIRLDKLVKRSPVLQLASLCPSALPPSPFVIPLSQGILDLKGALLFRQPFSSFATVSAQHRRSKAHSSQIATHPSSQQKSKSIPSISPPPSSPPAAIVSVGSASLSLLPSFSIPPTQIRYNSKTKTENSTHCWSCERPSGDDVYFCAACHKLQPPLSTLNFFQLLGLFVPPSAASLSIFLIL